jgi:hypothetical protein
MRRTTKGDCGISSQRANQFPNTRGGADMSNDKRWQDMTPDEQADDIEQIKTWVMRIADSLEAVAEKVKAIEDKLGQ